MQMTPGSVQKRQLFLINLLASPSPRTHDIVLLNHRDSILASIFINVAEANQGAHKVFWWMVMQVTIMNQTKWIVYHYAAISLQRNIAWAQPAIVLGCIVAKQFVFFVGFDRVYCDVKKLSLDENEYECRYQLNIANTILIMNLFIHDQLKHNETEMVKHSINSNNTNINCNRSNSDCINIKVQTQCECNMGTFF